MRNSASTPEFCFVTTGPWIPRDAESGSSRSHRPLQSVVAEILCQKARDSAACEAEMAEMGVRLEYDGGGVVEQECARPRYLGACVVQ
jgi:hypothetical protein